MLTPKDFFSLRSNPINLVGMIAVLYGLITLSWSMVGTGLFVWVVGAVFHEQILGPRKKQ